MKRAGARRRRGHRAGERLAPAMARLNEFVPGVASDDFLAGPRPRWRIMSGLI
jgi:hypothetical protein